MEYDGFRYDFTWQELCYFLFGNKKCLHCGGNLERHKDFEFRRGSDFNTRQDAFFRSNAKVKHYVYTYSCSVCKRKFTLYELANRKKR